MAFQYRDKILLLFSVGVIILSTLSYYSSLASDPTRCEVLLNEGFWLKPEYLINWQPMGCRLYWYENHEPAACLYDRRVVMVGGHSTKELFESLVQKLNSDYELPYPDDPNDVQATSRHVNFEFVWDPTLTGERINELRTGFNDDISRPALTVLGFERDQVKPGSDVATWSTHVDGLFSGFRGDTPERARQSDAVIFTPLLEPNVPRLAPSPVDDLNNVVRSLAKKYKIDVTFAFNDIIKPKGAMIDTKTIDKHALNVMSEILLNFRCNPGQPNAYPYAGTCCNTYPRASWIQVILVGTIVLLLIITPIAMYLKSRGTTVDSSMFLRYTPPSEYHGPMLALGVAGVLCWYLDRTNVFGKEQKDWSSFLLMLVSVPTVLSLYILKTTEKQPGIVEKRQNDDWKGIMQVIILMYRYCDYASTDYIYNTYLFILGAETTIYFLRDQEDYSWKRIVANILRLNLFRTVVAYSTGSDWTLNFFPLVLTWYYLVTLAVFVPYKHNNSNPIWLLGKFGAVVGATLLLYKIPKVIELVWSILSFFFHMNSDGGELKFRFTQDQYSCFIGIAVGLVYHLVITRIIAALPQTQLTSALKKTWLVISLVLNNSYTAWVGRGWLETFLLQFHTWLAADSAGLLMIGAIPASQRLLNTLLTTPLYFYISWLATNAVHAVIEWIMLGSAASTGASQQSYKGIPMGDANGEDELDDHDPDHFETVLDSNGSASHGDSLDDVEAAQAKEQGGEAVGVAQSSISGLSYDWRVRVGAGLILAAIMNWTWDL